MKFWKHSLLAGSIFLGIASTVTYTSCIHDSCKTLMCRNGGTCDGELCLCPDGWQGTQCEIASGDKFIGTYDGQTKVNSDPVRIDSAKVYYISGEDTPTTIETIIYSRKPEKLSGKAVLDHMYINNAPGKTITYKYLGEGKIEILIDEMVDGNRVITNFSGTKR
ncbi:MAG: hypothetical protein H6550_10205 [Chitinophagales bacterium]|nr:hypothetical protein [Chitinophagales bacterium]